MNGKELTDLRSHLLIRFFLLGINSGKSVFVGILYFCAGIIFIATFSLSELNLVSNSYSAYLVYCVGLILAIRGSLIIHPRFFLGSNNNTEAIEVCQ